MAGPTAAVSKAPQPAAGKVSAYDPNNPSSGPVQQMLPGGSTGYSPPLPSGYNPSNTATSPLGTQYNAPASTTTYKAAPPTITPAMAAYFKVLAASKAGGTTPPAAVVPPGVTSIDQINQIYDAQAGAINSAHDAQVGQLHSAYASGVAGDNQLYGQTESDLGQYGQLGNQENAAALQGVNGTYSNAEAGLKSLDAPMAQDLARQGAGTQAFTAEQAATQGNLRAGQANSDALSQEYGQIAQNANNQSQQLSSTIHQGGLSNLQSVLNAGLAQAAQTQASATDSARVAELRDALSVNEAAQKLAVGKPLTPSDLKSLASVASSTAAPTNYSTYFSTYLKPTSTGSADIQGGDVAALNGVITNLNAGHNPSAVLQQYIASNGNKANPYIVNGLNQAITVYNGKQKATQILQGLTQQFGANGVNG